MLDAAMARFPQNYRLPQRAGEIYLLRLKSDDPAQVRAWKAKGAELLARAPADALRRALPFPTTQQKYEFCGPAVLELCLRSLGIDLGQDEIARQIKRERGTPMFEIVRYLADHAIVARRVVATVDKVRAAIDLGLPMIIQEEYATTSHVAVIMGYDAALEVFLVRDPMTHQLSTRPWGWTESAGRYRSSDAAVPAPEPSEIWMRAS